MGRLRTHRNAPRLTAAAAILAAMLSGATPAATAQGLHTIEHKLDMVLSQLARLETKVDGISNTVKAINTEVNGITNTVTAINTEVNQTTSAQLCIQPAIGLTGVWDLRGKGQIPVQGTVGADVYGNGLTLKPHVAGETRLQVGVAGNVPLSLNVCFDLTGDSQAVAAGTYAGSLSAEAQQSVLRIATADLETLKAKAIETAAATRLELARVTPALDVLQGVSGSPDPLAAFDAGGELKKIAEAVPLPATVLAKFQQAGTQLGELFKSLRNPCTLELPEALIAPVGEICGLFEQGQAAKTALFAINTVKTAVDSVKHTLEAVVVTGVNAIRNAVCSALPGC